MGRKEGPVMKLLEIRREGDGLAISVRFRKHVPRWKRRLILEWPYGVGLMSGNEPPKPQQGTMRIIKGHRD